LAHLHNKLIMRLPQPSPPPCGGPDIDPGQCHHSSHVQHICVVDEHCDGDLPGRPRSREGGGWHGLWLRANAETSSLSASYVIACRVPLVAARASCTQSPLFAAPFTMLLFSTCHASPSHCRGPTGHTSRACAYETAHARSFSPKVREALHADQSPSTLVSDKFGDRGVSVIHIGSGM
jgi:hypothetical protein